MSRYEDPVIISCSISGVIANRDQCPAIPYTPEEYAAEARRAVEEGASQIHIHARKPDGTPSYEVEDFKAITEAIRGAVDDVIVNYSTGAIGISIEKRLEYLRECRPEVAALNMSSMNYAKYSRRRKDFVFKAVFENSFDTITEFLTAMRELGIKPEHECFDAGHVANLDPLIDMGLLEPPLQISLVMGVTGGIRPTPRNVTLMSDQIPGGPEGPNQWQLIGISRAQWKLLGSALVLGGNVRAGVEDNLYLPDGTMCRSNGDLIGKARQMAEDIGRRPATVAEARAMLGITARAAAGRLGSPNGERERDRVAADGRAGRGQRRPGADDQALPARGPPPRRGEDEPQHGVLPALLRRPDPPDQASAGGALHAAEGDQGGARRRHRSGRGAARAGGPDPRPGAGRRAHPDQRRRRPQTLRRPQGGARPARRDRRPHPQQPRLLALRRDDHRGDQPLPRGRLRRADRLHRLRHPALQDRPRGPRPRGGRHGDEPPRRRGARRSGWSRCSKPEPSRSRI